ncbi:hypothetical protein FisN_16Lh126 [Fistulifera solaris]|uniref:HMG box domain-containing protein n=1 Tax=Fistulifera solaris TaxID=1519565 RepID=A0A1Z5KJ12_FISSO|nr:hypothetical protein FisN_16Lh126 [Fistulifera solaris]|eukprot:GAX26290.1 hypothetical protein FisN_16Lh126 [Fistulifera solaris]
MSKLPDKAIEDVARDGESVGKILPSSLTKDDDGRDEKKSNKRKRSKKKDRRANRVQGQMPAPPLSAYNFFFRAERLGGSDGKRDGPKSQDQDTPSEADTKGLSDFQTMTKSIGLKWRELSADQKRIFEDLAKEDLGRYRRELAEYNEEIIRSTKIGRASLEGRIKSAIQHRTDDSENDAKPSVATAQIPESGAKNHTEFPGFPTQQFALPSTESNSQHFDQITSDPRESLGMQTDSSGLTRQYEPMLQQYAAENVILQHLLSGIAQSSLSTLEQSSLSPIFSPLLHQLQDAQASTSNARMVDSALSRAALFVQMNYLRNSQIGGRFDNLPSLLHSQQQPLVAQEAIAWRHLQQQLLNPLQNSSSSEPSPSIAEFLIAQRNRNVFGHLEVGQNHQIGLQNVFRATPQDQQALLQHFSMQPSHTGSTTTIATTPTIDPQELLRQMMAEEVRKSQQR